MRWLWFGSLITVTVASNRPEPEFGFARDVLPVLQRQGCASAYCHGSATGRGGLKLSLFGSDPRADWLALTQDLDGRRLDRRDAERSLLLAKPSLDVKHGGGLKLPRRSRAYARLRSWIEQGAAFQADDEAPATGLALVATTGGFAAQATFANGGTRDVTELVLWSSSDQQVVAVDDHGQVSRHRPGVAWVFARYGQHAARARLVQAFDDDAVARATRAASAATHPLDRAWLLGLAELGLEPATPAAPAILARRLWLDLVGRPPTPSEAREMAQLPLDAAIATATDRLVATRAFAEVWGSRLAGWLELSTATEGPGAELETRLRRELVDEVAAAVPLTEIVRRRLGARHPLWTRLPDPRDRAEYVARSFFGVRLSCARCHDHPQDRWRQAEHLAFAAWFADPNAPSAAMAEGAVFDPVSGQAVEPALLALPGAAPTTGGRLARVSAFVLDPGHGQFWRNLANRVLGALLGQAPQMPEDDHRDTNPVRHQALLDAAATLLQQQDLRGLVRAVVTSRLYAQDSTAREPTELDAAAVAWLARREVKPIDPATFVRAVDAVLGIRARALQLPPSPLARQLALLHGDVLHGALGAGGTQVDLLADLGGDPAATLRELFVLLLTREPTASEQATLAPLLAGDEPRQALHDLAFALLASREFGSRR